MSINKKGYHLASNASMMGKRGESLIANNSKFSMVMVMDVYLVLSFISIGK